MQSPMLPSEVILLIAPYLTRTSLLRCMRINKTWHDSLQPFLWRHPALLAPIVPASSADLDRRLWDWVDLRSSRSLSPSTSDTLMQRHHHPSLPPWPLPPVPLVHKNAPYVRSLHVENPTVLLREFVAPALGCCLLTSLSVSHTADLEAVLAILQRAANTLKSFTYRSTLRVSELNLQSDSSRLSRQLWTVLPACQALTHLKITSAGIPKECHEAFFQVCERLSSLSLIHTLFAQEQSHQEPATEERSEESIVIQRLCKTQFPNLKTMVLLNNSISSARQVAFIQQAAPSLKSLTWKTSSRFYTRCLASCLVEHGVQLTKLDVSLSVLSDSQLTRILIHLPQLDSLDAQSTGFGPRAAQVLLEHRAAQLQELNIKGCIDVEGRWMQLLLEACPRLRRFLCEYIDIRLILASLEKPSGGWASRELVELGISVSGLTTLDEPMIGMEKLLSQIAVMTKLEILDLVVNNNTKIVALNLDPGSVFSRQLGGLKKIRQVMLQGCQQPMTRATLDFLVQQWPRLEKVGFVFHSGEVNVDRARYQELDSYLAFTHPHLSRAQRQRKTCLFEDKATLPAAAV